jgi:DNA-binding transcriptional LysR family regulator
MVATMKYPDLQIDWLRAFVAVVDAGSLSSAAPLLHRSQSAVSMQIKKLEGVLGKSVLLRGPRHMEITAAGAELLSYARRMLELQAQTQAALFGPELEGRIRLGVPDDYASIYLAPVLRSFASRHHGVEIELTCEQSTSLIPKVVRGELDLALVSRDKPQRGKLLFQEPLVWVGRPSLRSGAGIPCLLLFTNQVAWPEQRRWLRWQLDDAATAWCITAPAWPAKWQPWKVGWPWPF